MKTLRMVSLALCLAVFVGVSGAQAATLFQPLTGISIVLDPGHGGADPGAIGPKGLRESATNLRVARYLALLLEADGARVVLTRTADTFLSLPARVEMAKQEHPDLFVSIHHNASLKPGAPNKGEIYFNALDQGIPLNVSDRMQGRLQRSSIGTGTTVIPGGFYVLRENEIPAVLTEAAYISVPEIEKKLRSGRALVDEARAFHLAIREAFSLPPLRMEVIGAKPTVISTPYFQLLLSASRPVAKLETRMEPAFRAGFSLDMIPAFGHLYTLSNTQPVNSGEYQLQITGRSVDGGISTMMRVPLSVRLPVESAVILPVAPYIPEGFVGSFPLTIQMLDSLERPNQRPVSFSVVCSGMRYASTTRADGRAGIVVPLNGSERSSIVVEVSAEGRKVGTMPLAVKPADETFILGRVGSSHTGSGIDRMIVVAENRQNAMTNPDGYFFLSLPLRAMNMKLSISPVTGYLPAEFLIKADGSTTQQPQIVLAPRSPALLGRRIGIIATRAQDEWARPIVRSLMLAGAVIRRLPAGSGAHPEYDSVATANREGGFDILITLKPASGTSFELRHYHRSTGGKRLADAVLSNLCGSKKPCGIKVNAGSDYELGHTAATALVIYTPRQYEKEVPASLAAALIKAMPAAFKDK